jgi:hypothetical protein
MQCEEVWKSLSPGRERNTLTPLSFVLQIANINSRPKKVLKELPLPVSPEPASFTKPFLVPTHSQKQTTKLACLAWHPSSPL